MGSFAIQSSPSGTLWNRFFGRDLNTRVSEKLIAKAEELFEQMSGRKETIYLWYNREVAYAGASRQQLTTLTNQVIAKIPSAKILHIHPLFALHPRDLPRELQITSDQDERAWDTDYLHRVEKWVDSHFKKEENDPPLSPLTLMGMAGLWSQPEKWGKVQEFALAHEVAHLFHNHKDWDPTGWQLFSFCVGYVVMMAEVISLGVATTACVVSVIAFQQIHLYISRQHEFEADLTAYKTTNNFEGAKETLLLFKVRRELAWNRSSWIEKISHTLCPFNTHPTPDARLAALKAVDLEG